MPLPDYIKIPGAVLIAHGTFDTDAYNGLMVDPEGGSIPSEGVDFSPVFGERGWLIFVKEPPVTKGETA